MRRLLATMLVALPLAVLPAPARAATGFAPDHAFPTTLPDVGAAPVTAMASNGYAVSAWIESVAGGQNAARVSVRAPGGAWGEPQQLALNPTPKSGLAVAVNGGGAAAVAWENDLASETVSVSGRPVNSGAFGAVETIFTANADVRGPALGVDDSSQIILLVTDDTVVEERVYAAGTPALNATSSAVRANCANARAQVAEASDGDAVATFKCPAGTFFALREGGGWNVGNPLPDTTNPGDITEYVGARVAIDSAGNPAGIVTEQRRTTSPISNTTRQVRLLLPVLGTMAVVPGGPVASGDSIAQTSIGSSDVGVGGGKAVVAWDQGVVQGERVYARLYTGPTASPAVVIDPVADAFMSGVRVALDGDGDSVIAWTRAPMGGEAGVHAAAGSAPPVQVSAGTGPAGGAEMELRHAGDGVVTYVQGPPGGRTAHARGYDAVPPGLVSSSFPATATAGVAAPFSATAFDFWGPVTLDWSFGEGGAATGAAVSHTYGAGGVFNATVTARDAVGNTAVAAGAVQVPPPPQPPTAPPAAPVLSAVSMTNTVFRVGPSATAISARRRRVARGTRFRFRLDKAATVSIVIERPTTGRRSGRRCVRQTARNRRAPRCTRYVKKGTLSRRSKAGANTVSFSGRIGRRALAPGAYRATITARANGKVSKSRSLKFRVVR